MPAPAYPEYRADLPPPAACPCCVVDLAGASLAPWLLPRTRLVVARGRAATPGDLCVMRTRAGLLAHYCLGTFADGTHRYYWHRGVAPGPAGLFRDDELVGVAVAAYRDGRLLTLPAGGRGLRVRIRTRVKQAWFRLLAAARRTVRAGDRPPGAGGDAGPGPEAAG